MMDNEEQQTSEEILANSLINMAVESIRFSRLFDRLLLKLDAGEQARYRSQFQWFCKKVEQALSDAGMHIVNIEGQNFDPGMAAAPINIEDFDKNDDLIVEQMIEPIIMGSEGLIRSGTVILRKAEE
jgi:molecular chaperone GrpE (heat shock protein)